MYRTDITKDSMGVALAAMADGDVLDILVIGGGVTGAGIALDAASRGLRVGIVEARDWASGTSSRSSGLVHGGLRYLYDLDVALVSEALSERGRLLRTIAPHLVQAQPFLWPLRTPVVERAYSALGVGMYDALAAVRGGRAMPTQRHYGRRGVRKIFPSVREDSLVGAIRFFDARVDDARLVLGLVRTAVGHGALAASHTEVTGLVRDEQGAVEGAVVNHKPSGARYEIRARHVINATGVWTSGTQNLAARDKGLQVLTSKGVHITVPRDRIDGSTGLFARTEKSVLFIIPWERYWLIGTTDTEWREDLEEPVATRADIEYLLEHANAMLRDPLTPEDVVSSYAGLRPLLQPDRGIKAETAKVSREHTIAQVVPGMSTIAGGKLTTYRVMAEEAVDFVLGRERSRQTPSTTADLPLVGAVGYQALMRQRGRIARRYGWDEERVRQLLQRYGDDLATLLEHIDDEPALGQPLEHAPQYIRGEVAFAVTQEGAMHLEDILVRRLRLDREHRDRGCGALGEIAEIAGAILNWSAEEAAAEQEAYRNRTEILDNSATEETDAAAMTAATASSLPSAPSP